MLGIIQIGDYLKYRSPKISMLVLTRLKVKAIHGLCKNLWVLPSKVIGEYETLIVHLGFFHIMFTLFLETSRAIMYTQR